MGFLFKLVASLVSLATTLLLVFESARRGLLILTTVLGILKIIVFVAFVALLAIICYLLLRSANSSPATSRAV
ncbi:MAG: hypothetical protein HYR56_13630 [Acidobacteria bacterium]|nr:hypothetical protein [Acidobacteriota bacterium]MBI3425221.1 hypothetical protein [Acidobacteriota bacterium]